jgi:tRNA nucleotidyltransferase (CCA-adding enzyme)
LKARDLEEILGRLESEPAAIVRAVLKRADAQAQSVFLVGGPVRDFLLDRSVRDVDLMVARRGDQGAAELARASLSDAAEVVAHDRFGTVTIKCGDAAVDLATARREHYPHAGALPVVEEGTLEEDLLRRDFSVNALALPLSRAARSDHPSVVDVVDGREDLAQRRLRVLHPRSFHDDPTRALRASRLAPRLGFTLARRSRSSLRDALRDGAFGRVSGDRLRREFVKLFDDATLGLDPSRALKLLSEWHVLAALEPGLTLEREVVVPLRRLGKAVAEPPWRPVRWRPWVAGLSLWLAPMTPSLRRRTLQRLSVRGETANRIGAFARSRDGWIRSVERARGRGAVDGVLRRLEEEDLQSLHASVPPTLRRRIVRYANEDRSRRLPVNGDDLREAGLEGPAIGRALERIRTAYLDGGVRDRTEALALAREFARRRGGGRAKAPKSGGKSPKRGR